MPTPPSHTATGPFAGLELLSSAVILVDGRLVIRYINPGAENLFAVSQRKLLGQPLERLLGTPPGLGAALENALRDGLMPGDPALALAPMLQATHASSGRHVC